MKKNLEINDFEDKKTTKGKRYTRFNTSEGWMSCFDSIACEELKKLESKSADVEVIESPNANRPDQPFMNISKCYGESDKVVTERPGEVVPQETKVKESRLPNHKTMYVSYAKDIFCVLYQKEAEEHPEVLMKICTNLVKQAKEAFE